MPRRPIPEGHEALSPRIEDLDVPISALDVPICDVSWRDVAERHEAPQTDPPRTWAAVDEQFETYADLEAAYPTYAALLGDEPPDRETER